MRLLALFFFGFVGFLPMTNATFLLGPGNYIHRRILGTEQGLTATLQPIYEEVNKLEQALGMSKCILQDNLRPYSGPKRK